MNRTWLVAVLSGLVGGAVILALPGMLQAQPAPASTGRVASVDIQKVLTEYERMKVFNDELNELQNKLNVEAEQRKQSADALQATVDVMDRNAPTFVKKLEEVLQARVENRTWFQVKQAYVGREVAVVTDAIYRDVLKATQDVAQQAGYDVVVYFDEYRASMNPEEIQAQIAMRRVLYVNPAVDITQFVLDKVNADFRTRPAEPQLHVP